jgi:hypothetical protein
MNKNYTIFASLLLTLVLYIATSAYDPMASAAAPTKFFDGCNPTNSDGSVKCCWTTITDGPGDFQECKTCKWSQSKNKWVCSKLTKTVFSETIDPKLLDNANNAGVLIDRGTPEKNNDTAMNKTLSTARK